MARTGLDDAGNRRHRAADHGGARGRARGRASFTATSSRATSSSASNGQVKVLDFGLARRFLMPDTGELILGGSTIPGRPMGTANYMAPERILQLPLDPRSDLFSLGVVIYEMATGRLPFGGASPSETVTQHPRQRPGAADVVLTRATGRSSSGSCEPLLAKRPDERYQSAAELGGALAQLRTPPPIWQRLFRRG